MEIKTKQELFETMVKSGFEPLRIIIERKRLHNDLSQDDVDKIVRNIGFNVLNWMDWMRHQDSHANDRRDW